MKRKSPTESATLFSKGTKKKVMMVICCPCKSELDKHKKKLIEKLIHKRI